MKLISTFGPELWEKLDSVSLHKILARIMEGLDDSSKLVRLAAVKALSSFAFYNPYEHPNDAQQIE